MPSKINASVSSGLVVDSDLTGSLQLQTGGNPAISIDSSQVTNFAKQFQIGGVLPPAFSASITTITSISNNTFTKITYDNEIFDTNNNYTNSKFTPTVAGYYYLTASLSGLSSFGTNAPIAIFKNGGWDSVGVNVNGYATVNALFYADGTTDYFEVYQYQNSGTTQNTSAQSQARFSGVLVRAA